MFRFITRRIITIIGIIGVVYAIYALYVWFWPVPISEKIIVHIPPGQRGSQTLELLSEKKVIRSPFLAGVYLLMTGQEGRLQAGDYSFEGTLTLRSIIHTLTNTRQYALEVSLTFREGITGEDMMQYLREQEHSAASTFIAAMRTIPVGRYPFLADIPANGTLEGFLFPDTYRVFPNATASDIIQGMLENFDHKLTHEMRAEIARQKRTIFDVVTLASIVEKEVSNDEDRAIVAGIFYKRMEEGMRLQSDATVNYITGKGLTQPSYNDLEADSPYNTYRHGGLPPGPIGNPGLSAIKATIYYKETPYLFFLTTREGAAIYSKTYDEHLENKRKYLSNTGE